MSRFKGLPVIQPERGTTSIASKSAISDTEVSLDEFAPMPGYILVKRLPPREKVGVVFLPSKGDEEQRKEYTFGRVLKMGERYRNKKDVLEEYTVQQDDIVYLHKYCGHDISLFNPATSQQEAFIVITENDVLAIVEDEGVISQ